MAVSRVHHISNPGMVQVSPGNGEFLSFQIEANGPGPRFQFSTDIKGLLLNQGTFPSHPTTKYEWTYLRDPSDIQQFELVTIALLFATNADYRCRVSLHRPAGANAVLDIQYTGGPTDFDTEVLRILIV